MVETKHPTTIDGIRPYLYQYNVIYSDIQNTDDIKI